ncbi:dynein regulatory complex protein 9 [Hylaeus volcanicus]|uniref:dynein regulatory complex protein 9 n=1 Tax=Hylaeus volcanicus TaxID=313075 RepID=UPI0023B77B55|nr:dynein regulatory complex protein 9 [Hylaeus volcanicus]
MTMAATITGYNLRFHRDRGCLSTGRHIEVSYATLRKLRDSDLEISDVRLGPDDIAGIEHPRERAAFTELYEDSKVLVESLIAHEKEERSLLAESDKLEEVGAQLEKMFNDETIAIEEKKKRILNELAEEQRDIEKLKLIADAELEYVTAWETARYEQNVLRGEMEIEKLERILNDRRVREKNEERVHNELTKFLTRETASFEEKSKELEERYVRERAMYEREIRRLRWEIKTRRKELEELEVEYRHNQEFIDAYLTEKETLRKEKEQKERARRSAIRIQAWWRGVMVRRKLGPYRPEEKKKKRPTKSKK